MYYRRANINKLIFTAAIIAAILVSVNYSFSQDNTLRYKYTAPRFVIELAGSYNLPIGQTRGGVEDFFTFKNYGLVYGIGFHLNVKYAANKKATIWPYFSGGFAQLQNDETFNSYIDSNIIRNGYPLSGNGIYNSTPGSSLLVIRNIYAGLGVQYMFGPRHSLVPFIGIEADYNFLWGFYQQEPRLVAGPEGIHKSTFPINSATRIGIAMDAGTDFRIAQNLGFVFGVKYSISNLFGKRSDATASGDNSMNLIDQAATGLNSNLSSDRNIGYLQFYLGFSLFFGKR